MYIKIERPKLDLGGARPINWLTIEATRFDHEMIPREDLELRKPLVEAATHMIFQDRVDQKGLKTTLDEVCVLKVYAPEFVVVLFDTAAYITNEHGDTIEKIKPRYDVVPDDGYEHIGYGHFRQVHGMEEFMKMNEPPCLRCAKKSMRLVKDGEFVGTNCDDCGEQLLEDWEAPRVPKKPTMRKAKPRKD